jgi:hypothetical protein
VNTDINQTHVNQTDGFADMHHTLAVAEKLFPPRRMGPTKTKSKNPPTSQASSVLEYPPTPPGVERAGIFDPNRDVRYQALLYFSSFCEVSDPNPELKYQDPIQFFKLLQGIRPQSRYQIPSSLSFFQAYVRYPTPTPGSDTKL